MGCNIGYLPLVDRHQHTAVGADDAVLAADHSNADALLGQKLKAVCAPGGALEALEEAKAEGFTGLFESKYGERVKTYTIGDFSKEICGGPHAKTTGELGTFKIKKEESSSKSNLDLEYYAKLGKIPECDYVLGEDVEKVREEIPFEETRSYVKKVQLAQKLYQYVYHQ